MLHEEPLQFTYFGFKFVYLLQLFIQANLHPCIQVVPSIYCSNHTITVSSYLLFEKNMQKIFLIMSAPVSCSPHSGQEDQLGEGVGRNVLDIVGLEVDVLEACKETHR